MPDSSLSQAIKEAYASAPADEVILHTIELRHQAFTVPIRVVNDHADLTATLEATAPENPGQAVLFQGFSFGFQPPDVDGPRPEIILTIDNVSREITKNIEAATISGAPVELTYRPYLSTDLSGPQMNPPLTLDIIGIEASMLTVTAHAAFGDLGSKRFPSEDYTAERFPGLVGQ